MKRFPKNAAINNQNTFQFDDLAEFILAHRAALVRVVVLESHGYLYLKNIFDIFYNKFISDKSVNISIIFYDSISKKWFFPC